jgi:3-oxoadipate enol-lactonase
MLYRQEEVLQTETRTLRCHNEKPKEKPVKVHVNGIDLAYSDEGQGPPIIFLHAFPLNQTMWKPQVAAFKEQYRVITIDLRGHGESDAPMWRYTLEQFADDIIALLQHLEIPQATFVGLSMGGYILFALYRKYPEYVRALVLADTRAQADTPEGKATRFSMAQVAYRRGSSAIADLMLPKLLSPSGMERNQELIAQLRAMIIGNQISGIVGDLMAMEERSDATPLAQTIDVPTLVLVGEQDIPSPPDEVKRMADQIPGSTFIQIPQAGHLSNMENPEAFNAELKLFLEKS